MRLLPVFMGGAYFVERSDRDHDAKPNDVKRLTFIPLAYDCVMHPADSKKIRNRTFAEWIDLPKKINTLDGLSDDFSGRCVWFAR